MGISIYKIMYFDGLRVCEVFEAESTKIHYTYGDSYTANTAMKHYFLCTLAEECWSDVDTSWCPWLLSGTGTLKCV